MRNGLLVSIAMAIVGAIVGFLCFELLVPATLAKLTPLFVGVGLISGFLGAIVAFVVLGKIIKKQMAATAASRVS